MKKLNLKIYAVLLVCMSWSVSCTDNFEEKNTSPNYPNVAQASTLLTTTIERAADRIWGSNIRYERLNIDGPMCWVGYLGRNIYSNEGDDYTIQPSMYNNNWKALYNDALLNAQRIVELSAPGGVTPHSNYEGIGLVLRSLVFSVLTDSYGPIPYSQALKGTAKEPIYTPSYDTQEAVYAGLLADLKTANEKMQVAANGGAPIVAGADLLYGGDILKWKKFANSLRLRLANRQAAKKPAESRQIIREIMDDPATYPVFTSNADNARLVHTANRPSNNEWHETMVQGGRTDWNVGKTLLDKLVALKDSRVAIYAAASGSTWKKKTKSDNPKNANGDPVDANGTILAKDSSLYVGIPNGLPDAVATTYLNSTSKIGTAFLAASAPSVIMTYSELQFILAEASLDGDATIGTAQTYFQNGITASFTQHGATIPASYILNLGPVTRELLFDQKYLALYGQGIEAWTEYRRTGLPVMPAKDPRAVFVNNAIMPTRLPYPTSEQSLNAVEYRKGVDLIGGKNDAQAKLWWVEN